MKRVLLGPLLMVALVAACARPSAGTPEESGEVTREASTDLSGVGQERPEAQPEPQGGDVGLAGSGDAVQRAAQATVRVELTHDVVCPWCRIAHVRLERAATASGRSVEIVYRPFLLEPDMPPEGADLRARLAAKYGASRLDAMFERVTQIGASDGIVFDFGKVTRSRSSVSAHMLVEAAPAEVRTALLDRVHGAYFERGEDIGDARVLERLWVESGLPLEAARAALADPQRRARVLEEALAASRSGLRGVPQMRIGDKTLDGAQPYEVVLEALRAVP